MLSTIAKSSRFRLVLIVLVSVILLVFSYSFVESIFFELYGSFLDNSKPPLTSYPTPVITHAINRSSTKDGAFVFLALGAQANQMNCPAAIESLVKVSGWSGHVYLLTDKSTCFDEPGIIRDSTIQADKLHIVQMNEHFDDMNYGFDGKSIDLRRNRKKSFRVKTLLFEHIPDPSITTLAYVDCDILFGQPGCAQRFIQAGTPWSSDGQKSSATTSDGVVSAPVSTVTSGLTTNLSVKRMATTANTEGTGGVTSTTARPVVMPSLKVTIKFLNEQDGSFEGIHCGTMVMHRQHSAEALRLWREQMDHGTEVCVYALYLYLYCDLYELMMITIEAH